MSSFDSGIPMPNNKALFVIRDQILLSYGAFYYEGLNTQEYMLVRARLPEIDWRHERKSIWYQCSLNGLSIFPREIYVFHSAQVLLAHLHLLFQCALAAWGNID